MAGWWRMIPFVVFTTLSFAVLILGLRWPLRRAVFTAFVIGLVVDALADLLLTRGH